MAFLSVVALMDAGQAYSLPLVLLVVVPQSQSLPQQVLLLEESRLLLHSVNLPFLAELL